MSRKIVVFFADTHGGHKLSLLSPHVVLWEEDEEGNQIPYTPRSTATQEFLWECYEEDWDRVERLADGDPVVIIHDGDLTWGTKYPSQLVSTREADQVAIAVANMERAVWIPNVQKVRLVFGTEAHTSPEGTMTVLVARQLGAMYPRVDVACLHHGLFSAGNVTIDCAHHGPSPGIRSWTAGNVLRHYVRSLMLDALADGEYPPRVLVRAHYHTFTRETVRVTTKRGTFVTEAFILPAYSGLSGHGHQSTRSKYHIGVGMLALEIIDGQLAHCHPYYRIVDLRTREEL